MKIETGRIRAALAALSSLFLGGCDEPRPVSSIQTTANTVETLPVQWTLTDVDGRRIDATIIGRSDRTITLIRNSDAQRFNLDVERLSEIDRDRVARLPLAAAPAPAEPSKTTGPLAFREAELENVRAEIEDIRIQLETSTSTIAKRSLDSRLTRLKAREGELMGEIRSLRQR